MLNHLPSNWLYRLLTCLFGLCLLAQPAHAQPATSGAACQPAPLPNARFGLNVAREGGKEITDYPVAQLHAGWYLDYTWHVNPPHPNGMRYLPMIRRWRNDRSWQTNLAAAIAANPGSLWILGNEPDHRRQDNRTPDDYAIFYHTTYTFLKQHDPTSRIAIAAVTQPTPLRLRYLDMVLSAYVERYGALMPIDVWTVHAYLLPENEEWGVGIPPALDAFADEGTVYTLDEHDNLVLFADQLRAFRRWMAARGYADKPLIVSEFGILLPPDYGYTDARVSTFMRQSFAWLQRATDRTTGYAADDYHLVQQWAWFSLNYYAYDSTTGVGHNGHLFDHASAQITPVGRAFAAYLAHLAPPPPRLTLVAATVTPTTLRAGSTTPLTIEITVANPSATTVEAFTLAVRWGKGQPQAKVRLQQPVAPHCDALLPLTITWTPPSLTPGRYGLQVQVEVAGETQGTSAISLPTVVTVLVE